MTNDQARMTTASRQRVRHSDFVIPASALLASPPAPPYHFPMRYRPFGTTGFSASEIGLGCWQLGGTDWGDVSDAQALQTLRAAADAGVNFFDTADVYGLGRSETLIGKFLRGETRPLFVATKLGRFPQPGWPQNFTPEGIRAHTEASLRRLG